MGTVRLQGTEGLIENAPPAGCRFQHDGVEATVSLAHFGVRHTMLGFLVAAGVLLLSCAGAPLLFAQGWTGLGTGLLVMGGAVVVLAALRSDTPLRATPRNLAIGRLERPRSEWGVLKLTEGPYVHLEHTRPDGTREWWQVDNAHAERVRWFLAQIDVMPPAEPGSEDAVPDALRDLRPAIRAADARRQERHGALPASQS